MSKSSLLKRINRTLSPNKVDFSGVDAEINALKQKLEETVNIQTVDDVKYELDKFKKKIDITPLSAEIEKIGSVFTEKSKELQSQIDEKSKELESLKRDMESGTESVASRIKPVEESLGVLKQQLLELQVVYEADIANINKGLTEISAVESRVNETIAKLSSGLSVYQTRESSQSFAKEIQDEINELRTDILGKLKNVGGGGMNRQIFINGVDPLTKFNDINLKAGNNVTISYVNNSATQKVDVTITSTGGSGGTVRSINSVSTNTNAGDTAGTDYVYLCSGTIAITLPTAVGNTNLYTIKNVGSGVVTVNTTGGQTIDNDSTVIMPTQYTSVDIISDSLNWNIT